MSGARTWLVTGISRGLGRALAEAVLARGETVVGTTRDGTSDLSTGPGTLHHVPFELADADAAEAMVARAFAAAGQIDVIVNNAGYGLLGAIEDASDQEAERVVAVNLLGPFRVIRAALPRLRAQGHGHILNVTSIAGRDPRAASGLYAAAKAGLEALTQALALEVAPLGLRVTAIAPGGFRTDFLSDRSINRSSTAAASAAYAESVGTSMEKFDAGAGALHGDPARAARAIIAAVEAHEPPRRLLLGSDAVDRAHSNIADALIDIERWKALSRSTDVQETRDA